MPDDSTLSRLLVNIALAALVLEIAGLSLWHRLTGRGFPIRTVILYSLPGLFLMIALKIAVSGGSTAMLALLLLASFAAHIADVRARHADR